MMSHMSISSDQPTNKRIHQYQFIPLAAMAAMLTMVVIAMQSPAGAAIRPQDGNAAHFSPDLRWVVFSGPGVRECRAAWSVEYWAGGQAGELASWSAPELMPASEPVPMKTAYGQARATTMRAADPARGVVLELTLGQLIDAPGFTLHGRLINNGNEPLEIAKFTLFRTDTPGSVLSLEGEASLWQAAEVIRQGFPPVRLDRVDREMPCGRSLGLYRFSGQGFFVGPATRDGTLSDIAITLDPVTEPVLSLRAESVMSGTAVAPGAAIDSEPILVLMESAWERPDEERWEG